MASPPAVKPGTVEKPTGEPRTAPVAHCPLCGSPDGAPFFEAPDRMHGVPGTFRYSRCNGCRTVYQSPRVVDADLPACYPSSYYTHTAGAVDAPAAPEAESSGGRLGGLRSVLTAAALRRPTPGLPGAVAHLLTRVPAIRERFTFGLLDEFLPVSPTPGRALDIGCGAGGLLVLLKRAGWTVDGVEWDPAAAAVAGRVSGRPVSVGDFQELTLPLGAYELIVLSHVFEHLGDPVRALHRLHDLLVPGGRVVLVYPNPEALGARLFGDAWYPWDPPRHLVMAPGPAVAERAREIGFVSRSCRALAREKWSVINFSKSRLYREGGDAADPQPTEEDRRNAAQAAAQCRQGLPAGDEVVLVLQKTPTGARRERP